MREGLITAILIIIMILNGIDVFVDIGLQVPFWHIVQEATLVLLSGLGAVLLIMHIRNKSQKLKNLVKDLSTANQQITSLTSKMAQERTHYS